ncbi:MAG: flagellin [bacterium]
MAIRINNNIASISALRNLGRTQAGLQRNVERLSSGLRINRAADDPAGLVISERFRAQIAGLNQAVENSETAISMISTAESAFTEIHSILTNMRDLAVHAANEGANDATQLAADQAQIQGSLDTINRIAANTQFGTKYLLDGSGDNAARIISEGGTDLQRAENSTLAQGSHTVSISNVTASRGSYADPTATSAAGLLTGVATPTSLAPGDHTVVVVAATSAMIESGAGLDGSQTILENAVLTINDGTTSYLVTFGTSGGTLNTAQNIVDEINADAGTTFTASVEADGSIKVVTNAVGGTQRIIMSVDGTSVTSAMLDMTSLTGANGTTASATLDGGPAVLLDETAGTFTLTDGKGGSIDLTENVSSQDGFKNATLELNVLGATFDLRLDNGATYSMTAGQQTRVSSGLATAGSVDLTVGSDVVAGNASLFVSDKSLVFQVGANAGQTVKIGLSSVNAGELGRGISSASGFESLADIDVTSAQGASDALAIIDEAIDKISRERAELGAFQLNTLESNLANLRIAAENLQAADSVIRDTDVAAEVVNFTKNQILNQAGTAVLAQANLLPQSLLSLLG